MAESLDISKFSKRFKNRMISLRGSIRSLGLEIIGVRVDSEKGLIVDKTDYLPGLVMASQTCFLKKTSKRLLILPTSS